MIDSPSGEKNEQVVALPCWKETDVAPLRGLG